jgi:hypothetical protein
MRLLSLAEVNASVADSWCIAIAQLRDKTGRSLVRLWLAGLEVEQKESFYEDSFYEVLVAIDKSRV